MEMLKTINLGLRFFVELAMLAALGYWGFRSGFPLSVSWLLGIGAPLLAAVVWGALMSPKASVPLSDPLKLAIEIALFVLSAAALYAADRPAWAVVFLVVWAVNRIGIAAWNQ